MYANLIKKSFFFIRNKCQSLNEILMKKNSLAQCRMTIDIEQTDKCDQSTLLGAPDYPLMVTKKTKIHANNHNRCLLIE